MEITSEAVGKKMKLFQTDITQRQVNNYAAAVNDPNPFYLDDERKEGLVAHPTLAAAITWPLIQNIYAYIDLEYPPEIMFQIVHYSEYLAIHRPLVPGDKISITGEVAAVVPEKNGTHVVFKLPALDSKNEPVFTEYIGGMLRGVKCLDQGRGKDSIPAEASSFSDSQPLWEVSLPITRLDCYIYESCANVPFPIHTSPAFARSVGLPDIIYFGIGTLARGINEIINRENGADPRGVKAVSCRFRGMVSPESFIRIQLLKRVIDQGKKELYFRVLNREDKEAVSSGYILIS